VFNIWNTKLSVINDIMLRKVFDQELNDNIMSDSIVRNHELFLHGFQVAMRTLKLAALQLDDF
jgi:hypothetical protein